MTYRIGRHAAFRLRKREITISEIEAVITNPARIEAEGGRRNLYEARGRGRLIHLVVEFNADPPVVVTVMAPEEE